MRKGVFRGDTIGQVQVAGKPVPAVYGKLMNPSERVGTAKNAADGHEDNVDERVLSRTLDSRVWKILKMMLK